MAQSSETVSPFRVDHDDELPVGIQLEWRLRSLIASGRLAHGDRLPSVRALAEWAGVNVNTVRAAYAGLEQRGLVASQQGAGTFVAAGDVSPELERIATRAIAEARELGGSARELAMLTFVCASLGTEAAIPEPGTDADQLQVREELRRQIGHLEAQLAAHARDLPQPEPVPAPQARAPGRVVGVEQLEQTRDALVDRLATARETAASRGARERRARQVREEMVIDPGSHRWQTVSDAEMGEAGCRDYTVSAGPLGSLMSWWRLKVSGGCPLAEPA